MYEVEVKVPAEREPVRSRLEELGSERRGTVVQRDTYYDAPHRSFAETDEALRVRSERPTDGDETVRLTYKGPLVDDESKTRAEVETGVADGRKMATILSNLGFEAVATVRKERDRFRLANAASGPGEYTVTLDAVDDVGEFVEVEAEIESERELDSARDGAYDVLERIGLDPDDQIRTSYLELLLES
ncbi:class IV adenylate cyclase [Natrarchaeobius oligotrophus]|uniref:Class IV adenylate cyclase n=1 Tax=Natrarchaeobius chitinivorans TaxID=1679083 RepID=A0A3N6PLU4_NATCH|nr:class IV adenylate cyclase [Natrarchaeobius chitinivorans]RQG99985.1 class IV adenylate cyclase [Natrarchaeobius chitinivorans]